MTLGPYPKILTSNLESKIKYISKCIDGLKSKVFWIYFQLNDCDDVESNSIYEAIQAKLLAF